MNSKTISKIVVTALPAICMSAQTVSGCRAGELLRKMQIEQSQVPLVSQNQVMQNVFKNLGLLTYYRIEQFLIKQQQ